MAHDNGDGPQIYATGFGNTLLGYADPVRRWDGRDYVPVGAGLTGPSTGLYSLDDGGGRKLYHRTTTQTGAIYMRRWSGTQWEKVPNGMHVSPAPLVGTYIEPRFSSSRRNISGLYAFKLDYDSPPSAMNQVVRRDGSEWTKIGACGSGVGLDRMAEFFTEGRWNLVVSGGFFEFAGLNAHYLVRWDGTQWHSMADVPGAAQAITTWDDGRGAALYIGWAGLPNSSPLGREGIARWNGTTWESVGGGLYGQQSGTGGVWDMAVFDDGTGPALFVVGRFDFAGGANGIPARNIAKWNGHEWSPLGAGVGIADYLAVADDGRGPSLFVGGALSSAGGGTVYSIAQWVGCAGGRQCYADCDNNRILNANDFQCFLNKYAAKDPYSNCDVSTQTPAINAADFQCYLNKFAAGCP